MKQTEPLFAFFLSNLLTGKLFLCCFVDLTTCLLVGFALSVPFCLHLSERLHQQLSQAATANNK